MAESIQPENSPIFKPIRPMPDQSTLHWQPGYYPRFAKSPDVAAIRTLCRKYLSLDAEDRCDVKLLRYATRHLLFTVDIDDSDGYIFRVVLPVFPREKLTSEITTMQFLEEKTSIPVPNIIAYSTDTTEIGFEYVLMTRMPGRELAVAGMTMSKEAKIKLVSDLAECHAELFRHKFRGVGSLQEVQTIDDEDVKIDVGPICSTEIFMLDHLTLDIPRGPFKSIDEWLKVRLDVFMHDQNQIINGQVSKLMKDPRADPGLISAGFYSHSHGTVEEARDRKRVAEDLKSLISKVFPVSTEVEKSILCHHDLFTANIMVGDDDRLSGIIDWELAMTTSMWEACQLPAFLQPAWRETNLIRREVYAAFDLRSARFDPAAVAPAGDLGDRWEWLPSHEQDELAEVYVREMNRLCPEWEDLRTRYKFQRNIVQAVTEIGTRNMSMVIGKWTSDALSGSIEDDLARILFGAM